MHSSRFRTRATWLGGAIAVAAALALVFTLRASAQSGGGHDHVHTDPLTRTEASVEFRDDMRKLWEDHITWTRLAIVDLVGNTPDTQPTLDRLLQNQVDIGNALKPLYGEAAGDQLTSLLHDHIVIAAELINDAKADDNAALADAQARWYANANDIAAFLHSASPQAIPLADAQQMMKTHLDLTLQEASDQLQGKFTGSIATYDQVHAEILQMADMISLGVMQQFPKSFR
jgi:hypothetical protein